jgi:hypothetical protein
MTNETWIVYKTESMDATGWENRQLMPGSSLTDILHEEWDSSGVLPQVGDRIREYAQMEPETSSGITHGRDGDWVVTSINQFSSFDTNQRIVVCYCTYQPVTPDWEKLGRGAPVQATATALSDN